MEVYYYLEQWSMRWLSKEVHWEPIKDYTPSGFMEFESENKALAWIESQTPYFDGWQFKIQKVYRVKGS